MSVYKLLIVVIVLALVASLLVACGKKDEGSQQAKAGAPGGSRARIFATRAPVFL